MRLTRIRLRNYRGIDDREISFEPTGVTVIEGPNEVGKSSIAEAIDLLLEELDSTSRQEVKAVKPVDRDAGPEVELELESPPYAIRYRKRFLRERLTELEISRPRHESLTGREAHERVQQILRETVDPALWKALRVSQGVEVRQAALGGARSLAAALDRAAGTVPAGTEEVSLFDRVRNEYVRYFTETGREKAETAALAGAADARTHELEDVERALQAVTEDVERSARLQAEVRRLTTVRAEQEARLAELAERWALVERLQAAAAAAVAREETTRLAAERAAEMEANRGGLIDALAATVTECDRCQAEVDRGAPDLDSARERSSLAAVALAAARAARERAETDARTRRADADYLREAAALADLRERKRRVDEARESLARAAAMIEANGVEEATLVAIRAADVDLQKAGARLDAQRPTLSLRALSAVTVELDGEPLALTPGEPTRRSVTSRASVVVPGLLAVDVVAGADDTGAVDALRAAERRLGDLCREVGVTDVAAAERAAETRRTALATKADQERVIGEVLGPQGLDSLPILEARIATAEETVGSYRASRTVEHPLAADAESAREALGAADRALGACQDESLRAEREESAARARLGELEANAREAEVLMRIATDRVAIQGRLLAEARAADPDQALAERRAGAQAAAATVALEAREADAALKRETPEQARNLLDNASDVRGGTDRELRAAQDSLLEVATRLRDHGEEGLAEQRDRAITLRDAASRDLATQRARAAARRLLYEVMRDARETARRAYVGPLRDRIEGLGRNVFGESFHVDVTDDLRIASRTLRGRTIPFTSLSVGTQEQLGVIMRLACAMIVAPDGGVPLILDDALGYSDPDRLEAMGAVLSLAGRSCQVIVLTCYPERYRHVGGATIQRIG